MKHYLLLLLITSLSITLQAAKAPIKFGKIDPALVAMKRYDADTSAPAVILCDYGYFNADRLIFVRTLRIKILTKDGYKYANNVYSIDGKANIRGITYNMVNGIVEETKLQNSGIFEERVYEDNYRTRVAMPNIKEGSVVDIEFSFIGLPMEWNFQDLIPVAWSELLFEESPYIKFSTNFMGYFPLTLNEDNHWISCNVPAFKDEPYMKTYRNYISRLEIDLKLINIGGFVKEYCNSWESVGRYLMKNAYFGAPMENSMYLKSIADEIKQKNLTDEGKLEAAFNAIKVMKWDENQTVFTSMESLSYPFKHAVGNSADINLALLQLLRRLDFKPMPVVLSTRDNGLLRLSFPTIGKLNHVIVSVVAGNNAYLLDATEDYYPWDLLPTKCINWMGVRIIEADRTDWVELSPTKKDKVLAMYNLTLNDDLSLTGSVTYSKYDYAAVDMREKFHSFNGREEYVEDLMNNNPGLQVNSTAILGLDTLKMPVQEKYEVRIDGQVTSSGNEIYINPLLYEQLAENPFKQEVRNYAVDYGYQTERSVIINISLPPSYKVTSMPAGARLKLPDNAATFSYMVMTNMSNQITANCKYSINKPIFMPEEYADLRTFFGQIVKYQADPVVIATN